MNYEVFKQAVTEQIQQQLGSGVWVEIHQIPKNNGLVKEGMIIRSSQKNISPTFYLKEYFQMYESGKPLARIVNMMAEEYRSSHLKDWKTEFFTELEIARQHICYKIVNFEENRQQLKEVPYVPFLDLAIVFYYKVDQEISGGATILIQDKHRQSWGITIDELHQIAKENTIKKLPSVFMPMLEVIRDIADTEGLPSNFEGETGEEGDDMMYVLTNQDKYLGAGCILYPNVLKDIAEKLKSNLFILPSSIHECIIMPDAGKFTTKTLGELVTDMNEHFLNKEEVLSNKVYYYHAEEEIINSI